MSIYDAERKLTAQLKDISNKLDEFVEAQRDNILSKFKYKDDTSYLTIGLYSGAEDNSNITIKINGSPTDDFRYVVDSVKLGKVETVYSNDFRMESIGWLYNYLPVFKKNLGLKNSEISNIYYKFSSEIDEFIKLQYKDSYGHLMEILDVNRFNVEDVEDDDKNGGSDAAASTNLDEGLNVVINLNPVKLFDEVLFYYILMKAFNNPFPHTFEEVYKVITVALILHEIGHFYTDNLEDLHNKNGPYYRNGKPKFAMRQINILADSYINIDVEHEIKRCLPVNNGAPKFRMIMNICEDSVFNSFVTQECANLKTVDDILSKIALAFKMPPSDITIDFSGISEAIRKTKVEFVKGSVISVYVGYPTALRDSFNNNASWYLSSLLNVCDFFTDSTAVKIKLTFKEKKNSNKNSVKKTHENYVYKAGDFVRDVVSKEIGVVIDAKPILDDNGIVKSQELTVKGLTLKEKEDFIKSRRDFVKEASDIYNRSANNKSIPGSNLEK